MNRLKAIIMAGGEGSRLRPLTCDCPKPMLRLLGKPLMEYALQAVRGLGITETAVTLGYLPDAVTDAFGDGEAWKMHLRYYIEKTPLGTAGSVRQAADFLNERFIVLSGDGIMDLDLRAALRFHAEKHALATLVLVQSAAPQEYGMVVTAADGRIRAFHEKPGRSDVYSDRINSGIYILEPEILRHIPETGAYDFGHDLFPKLVKLGLPVYGCTLEGYWCDVGDVAAYLRVHADALDGKIHLDGLRPSTQGAAIEDGAIVEFPVYVAPGARVCAGAQIGAYSCIGAEAHIAPNASIKRGIVLEGAQIGAHAQLRGCVAGRNAAVGESAALYEESVAGSHARIGDRATLLPGVKLWPRKRVDSGARAEANIVWGAQCRQRFVGGALMVESPAQMTRAAESCMAELKPNELLIGRGASSVADAMTHAAVAGAMAHGAQCVDAGVCTLPQLRHALAMLRCDAALLAEADRLIPLRKNGARLDERTQRAVCKLFDRQDFAAPFKRITRQTQSVGWTDAAYIADCAAAFTADPARAPRICLQASSEALANLAERTCERAGLELRRAELEEAMQPDDGEIGISLVQDGERALICDANGPLSAVEEELAHAWTALVNGEQTLLLPVHATRATDALAAQFHARTRYLPGEPAVWMNALANEAPLQFALQADGLRFALAFLSALTVQNCSLVQWRDAMPRSFRSDLDICVPTAERGRLLRAIAQSDPAAELGGGVRVCRDGGWAWFCANESDGSLHLTAEAAKMEAAQELCGFYRDEIQRLLRPQGIENPAQL